MRPFRLLRLLPAILPCLCLPAWAEDLGAPTLLPAPAAAGPSAETLADPGPSVPVAEADPDEAASTLISLLQSEHAWASWEPGAWRRVRTVSEAFDAEGRPLGRGVTEKTERLIARDDASYELEIEAVTLLSGRPTPSPIERRKLWVATDRPFESGEPILSAEPASSISLGGVMTPCRVWRIEQPTAVGSETTLLHLADQGFPSLLRREVSATSESEAGSQLVESLVGVGAPVQYGDSLVEGWRRVTTVARPSGGRNQSVSVHSLSVPGGLHHEAMAEYDADGARVRWSITDLIAAGDTPEEELASRKNEQGEPTISIEVRPRRLLRLLRRQRQEEDPEPEPLQ